MANKNLSNKINIQIHHQGVAAGPLAQNRFQSSYANQNNKMPVPVNLSKKLTTSKNLTPSQSHLVISENINDQKTDLSRTHFNLGYNHADFKTTNT